MANLQGQWENIIKRRWFSMRIQIFSEFSFSGKWELREREYFYFMGGLFLREGRVHGSFCVLVSKSNQRI